MNEVMCEEFSKDNQLIDFVVMLNGRPLKRLFSGLMEKAMRTAILVLSHAAVLHGLLSQMICILELKHQFLLMFS